VTPHEQNVERETMRRRLLLISLLDDGEFARLVTDRILDYIVPKVEPSLAAAIAAGDAHPIGLSARDALWTVYQFSTMIGCIARATPYAMPFADRPPATVRELTIFALRGLGLTDAAIAAHIDDPLADFDALYKAARRKEAS
jgi:hypothetical protein